MHLYICTLSDLHVFKLQMGGTAEDRLRPWVYDRLQDWKEHVHLHFWLSEMSSHYTHAISLYLQNSFLSAFANVGNTWVLQHQSITMCIWVSYEFVIKPNVTRPSPLGWGLGTRLFHCSEGSLVIYTPGGSGMKPGCPVSTRQTIT